MAQTLELTIGRDTWRLEVAAERLVSATGADVPLATRTAAELMRDALEHPYGFEAMRRALTPDDRVAITLDTALPEIAAMLGEVLAHLGSAGILPEAVTLLLPPGSPPLQLDELAESDRTVHVEVHDPKRLDRLAYLASTKSGRRVYLNRTLVESDFVVLLTGRRYDPLSGYAGAEAAVFPDFANEEIRAAFAGEYSTAAPGAAAWPARAEAEEVIWLVGMPFLIQAIEGAGDTIQEVVAGLPNSSAEGIRRQDAHWRGTVAEEPDTVIAAVSGDSAHTTFLDLAKAAAAAARVVRKGGRIAVLSAAAPELGEGATLLRSLDGPGTARKRLAREKPDDWAACYLWAFAAKNHSLFLASGYPDDVAEELFTTPIHSVAEVQRLIDSSSRVLLIPDAHKSMVEVVSA